MMIRIRRTMLVAGLAFMLGAGPFGPLQQPAQAIDLNPRQWGLTSHPFTDVGNRSTELTRLCRLGKFNQRRIAETFIRYDGPKGRGLLGIAKQDYNLYDPTRASEPDKTYHFHYDGTSRCKVFVAP